MDWKISLPLVSTFLILCHFSASFLRTLQIADEQIAKEMFREKDLCRVMHHASFNGALIAKPIWGLIDELNLDDDGMRRLHEEKELVLGTQGDVPSVDYYSKLTFL